MCGIVGILDFEDGIDELALKNMRDALHHRGPDDTGLFIDKFIGLGHTRLSIIDLSKAGHQPMSNEDGTVWITYNGEIYNYIKIRSYLEKKGHRFKSHTDTEVILHAYEEFGVKCLSLLNGMFAFGIWDSKLKQLFLARDRMGEKPLYCYHKKNLLIFASELKSLILHPKFHCKLNYDSISHYLTYGYVPHPYSIYKDCYKLNPAHYMICTKDSFQIKKYWDLNFTPTLTSAEPAKKQVLKCLNQSVLLRLHADVPVGVFLSGGMDSSAIVSLMSKHTDNIHTYSIGFDNDEYDETKFSRKVARLYNTNHKEYFLKDDLTRDLNMIVNMFDEPFADSASIGVYYLAKLASKDVKVCLSGDGADEIFAGYERFVKPFLNKRYCPFSYFGNRYKSKLLGNGSFLYRTDSETLFKKYLHTNLHMINVMINTELKLHLPDQINTKTDIASMANSLEVRNPYLDHHLIELAAKMDPNLKINYSDNLLTQKYILKESLKGLVPTEIIFRKKQGFLFPIDSFVMKNIDIIEEKLMNKDSFSGRFMNKRFIKSCLFSSKHHKRIWNLLVLNSWIKNFEKHNKINIEDDIN